MLAINMAFSGMDDRNLIIKFLIHEASGTPQTKNTELMKNVEDLQAVILDELVSTMQR